MPKKSLILALCAVTCAAFFISCHRRPLTGTTADGFHWTLRDDKIVIDTYTGAEKEVTIPAAVDGHPVTELGWGCFSRNADLVSVVVPDSVVAFGTAAFHECPALSTVEIGASVGSLVADDFFGCWGLTSVNVSRANGNYSSIDGVLFDKAASVLILYPAKRDASSYRVPASVTAVGAGAFANCSRLVSVTLPASVESIGNRAFSGADVLGYVRVERGSPLPLTDLLGDSVFDGNLTVRTIRVPDDDVAAYRKAPYWSEYASSIKAVSYEGR